MHFDYIRKNRNGEVISSYDDSELREIAKKALFLIFGFEFIDGPFKGIDLVRVDKESVGGEGEDGSWDGDRWVSDQADIFGQGYYTLNLEHRKWHYWNLQYLSDKYLARIYHGKFDEGWQENFYFRLNLQGDQMIIVLAETILNPDKRKVLYNRYVGNNTEHGPEDWLVFRREHVLTYNKQPDGQWILDGKYHGPDIEECIEIQALRKLEGIKRAIQVHKEALKNKQ